MSSFFRPDPKVYSQPKPPKGLKQKAKEPTGELTLFRIIFLERGGKCEITGHHIEFHPGCFGHILSKGSHPKFRLYKKNIIMCLQEIHQLYDCSSKEYLLSVYPKAKIIYDLKEE